MFFTPKRTKHIHCFLRTLRTHLPKANFYWYSYSMPVWMYFADTGLTVAFPVTCLSSVQSFFCILEIKIKSRGTGLIIYFYQKGNKLERMSRYPTRSLNIKLLQTVPLKLKLSTSTAVLLFHEHTNTIFMII